MHVGVCRVSTEMLCSLCETTSALYVMICDFMLAFVTTIAQEWSPPWVLTTHQCLITQQ